MQTIFPFLPTPPPRGPTVEAPSAEGAEGDFLLAMSALDADPVMVAPGAGPVREPLIMTSGAVPADGEGGVETTPPSTVPFENLGNKGAPFGKEMLPGSPAEVTPPAANAPILGSDRGGSATDPAAGPPKQESSASPSLKEGAVSTRAVPTDLASPPRPMPTDTQPMLPTAPTTPGTPFRTPPAYWPKSPATTSST